MRRGANGSFNIEINTADEVVIEAFDDALGDDDNAADDKAGNEKISFAATVWNLDDLT